VTFSCELWYQFQCLFFNDKFEYVKLMLNLRLLLILLDQSALLSYFVDFCLNEWKWSCCCCWL